MLTFLKPFRCYPFAVILCIATFVFSCTKVDYTTLGGELIPAVDNINTFDTLLEVISVNELPIDSTRMFSNDGHPVGRIENDPEFGTTASTLFFEMKPISFPFIFTPKDSLIKVDSAVMVLTFKGWYGDSVSPVNLKLYQVDQQMVRDTNFTPTYSLQAPFSINYSKFLGEKTVIGNKLRDSIELFRGTRSLGKVNNQLRIPIDIEVAKMFLAQDSLGAYKSDTTFMQFFKGFALEAQGPANSIFYFGLKDIGSQLVFYYQSKNGATIDSASKSFANTSLSAHALRIDRNRNGSEFLANLDPNNTIGQDKLFVQSTPGTQVRVKIPGIATLTNRIIHRAELRVTEYADASSSLLGAPNLLYLDAIDAENNYRGVPYDLNPFVGYYCFPTAGGVRYDYFGGAAAQETINSEKLKVFRFNLTRYIQSVITRKEAVYDFRLSAPYYQYYKLCSQQSVYPANYFMLRNAADIAANLPLNGQIVLAGGNHPNSRKRMQLRIIYSKL